MSKEEEGIPASMIHGGWLETWDTPQARKVYYVGREELQHLIEHVKKLEWPTITVCISNRCFGKLPVTDPRLWSYVGNELKDIIEHVEEGPDPGMIKVDVWEFCNPDAASFVLSTTNPDKAVWVDEARYMLSEVVDKAAPELGGFYMWKSAVVEPGCSKKTLGAIVKLWVPADANRVSSLGPKIRVSKAEVRSVYHISSEFEVTKATSAISLQDNSFVYNVGEEVVPYQKFYYDTMTSCACGIHGFMDCRNAVMFLMANGSGRFFYNMMHSQLGRSYIDRIISYIETAESMQ